MKNVFNIRQIAILSGIIMGFLITHSLIGSIAGGVLGFCVHEIGQIIKHMRD